MPLQLFSRDEHFRIRIHHARKNNEHSPIERENSQALLKQNIASNYYLKEKTKGPAGSKRQSV